jgi:hypothetical protein
MTTLERGSPARPAPERPESVYASMLGYVGGASFKRRGKDILGGRL